MWDLTEAEIREAVALATDLDSIRFPKGTRLRGDRAGQIIILPNGRQYRLTTLTQEPQ